MAGVTLLRFGTPTTPTGTARQFVVPQLPGRPPVFVNTTTDSREYVLPGGAYLNED